LDVHRYSGCVGLACCPADRCWNGRRLHTGCTSGAPVQADAFDRPLQVLRYTSSDCPNCRHAVDLEIEGQLRSAGGRLVERWTICDAGLWAGPASLYNLLNHRAPIRRLGHCPSFEDTPPEDMRPELVAKRAGDLARTRRRRAELRAAKVAAARPDDAA
jgi:hypothetical protein